jgi:drug/metabolite transporter (DMT)-like permease
MDVFAATAWQVTAAGAGNLLFALLNGDLKHATWAPRSLAATGYLVVCGSWIGYTAYIWLLEHVPTSKVSTYAYVNPVVAVFLGWLLASEPLTMRVVLASIAILAAIVLIRKGERSVVAKRPEVVSPPGEIETQECA